MTDNRTTELESLSKLKMAGKLRYWRGTIEMPESELHAICDEIQAEHDQVIAVTIGGTLTAEQVQAMIFAHSSCAGRVDGKYFAEDIRMQAIADELNAKLGSDRDEIYNAGFDNGVKATVQQLEGLIAGGAGMTEVEEWVDEQWEVAM